MILSIILILLALWIFGGLIGSVIKFFGYIIIGAIIFAIIKHLAN